MTLRWKLFLCREKHIDGDTLNLISTMGNISFENIEILHPDEYILQKMVPKCKRHVQESI